MVMDSRILPAAMKSFAVVVFLVALGFAHAKLNTEEVQKRFSKCKEETGAEETYEDIIVKEHNPTTEKGLCLASCLLRENGIYDSDGKFSEEGAKKYFSKVFAHIPENIEKSMALSKECSKIDEEGLNKCEVAAKYVTCARLKASQQSISLHD